MPAGNQRDGSRDRDGTSPAGVIDSHPVAVTNSWKLIADR